MTRLSKPAELESDQIGVGDESVGKTHKSATKKNASNAGKKPCDVSKDTSYTTATNEPANNNGEQAQEGSDEVVSGKRQERALIFHLLYAAEGFEYHESLEAIVDNFNRGFEQNISLEGDVFRIAQAVITERDALDEAIKPFLANWRFERISVCTKLILRLAFWELLNTDVPPVILINEAIELTKCFAESDAYRFVNGVLDSFVKSREQEAK